jgi:signal transduction histidine kinase
VVWFIVQLDNKYLTQHLFPELAERYFGGTGRLAYRVAVISIGRDHQLLYTSDPDFGSRGVAGAEFTINIFGPPFGTMATHGAGFVAPPPQGDYAPQARTGNRETEKGPDNGGGAAGFAQRGPSPPHIAGMSPFLRFEPIHYDGPPSDWQVVLSNRGGSLEAVAAALRRRNLAISFGVLLVLAATVGIILVASQRAQRLASLQMDFVAAVSHELRTPLTVISSAAENIADGVVDNRQQVMRYGDVIKSQARQLIHIVEQVLLFAATREGAHRYHFQTLAVPDIVHAALETTAGLVSAAGFTVEHEVEPNLPPVEGDMVALTQCLQNLVTNAVKYGGDQRWVGIRAALHAGEGREEIRISVSDRGEGIAREDLEHIFQPFYRSVSATAAQIHGTGLGLPLAQTIAEAMNGRITVSSEPGQGSTFVLHLPLAAARALEPEEAAAAGRKVS